MLLLAGKGEEEVVAFLNLICGDRWSEHGPVPTLLVVPGWWRCATV